METIATQEMILHPSENGADPTVPSTQSTNGAEPPSSANQSNIGHVRGTDITDEMQVAYLDYAMSVIVSRALPDVRDGLKPVHRRILYAMYHDLGLTHDKPHKKSARIVGEVLGKYHPHGDVAVYDAMVRMAQDFSLRYPLVDGQGNFGSVDGDNAAAMRYTEARLAAISDLMLADLEKDTVDWHDNFDNSLEEPDILPATLPNLLINGANGIAVGMATNIPPHNLGEVVDALTFMIDHYDTVEEITVDQLTQFILAPDFPTGGILYRFREDKKSQEQTDAIAQGYAVGRSRLIIQAKAHFEEMSRNRSRIVVTELPYQTNKTSLIERIASLVRDGKIEGITDLRDESDRTGMRIVIELTRNVEPKNILTSLFKFTPLQQTFGMQMLALVDGQPRTLGLKRILQLFIEHRKEIVRRRSEYDLARARARAHIVEGLLRALDIMDEVIATIRRSQRVDTARKNLMKDFEFSEVQAQAILDMPLRRLAALERKKLQDEFKELKKLIKYLESLLNDPSKVLEVIKEELLNLKELYGDERRTQIVDRTKGTLTTTDLMPEQPVWVSISERGQIKRRDIVNMTEARLKQFGKGREVAFIETNTRHFLYLFTHEGQCRRVAVNDIMDGGKGQYAADLTDYTKRDKLGCALTLPRVTADVGIGYLFLVTELGVVKRITMSDFLSSASSDPIVINVENKDKLRWIFHTQGEQDVLLVASSGKSICFNEEKVRSSGLPAGGVGGMKLKKDETIVYAAVINQVDHFDVMTITSEGFAKRSALSDYSIQGRNGGGIVTHKLTAKTGAVATALLVTENMEDASPLDNLRTILTTKGQIINTSISEVPRMGRNVLGKQIIPVVLGDAVKMVFDVVQTPDVVQDEEL
ncbi:MAG: DNA gyrase subunit A [Chloroflexota bacterium]